MAYDVTGTVTVGDLLREHARSRPGLTAVADGKVELSYAQLDTRVNRLANALRDVHGIGAGDRILWLAQNSTRLIELLGAAGKLGACVVPANWRSSAEELAFVIDDLRPALIVWQHHEIGEVVAAARAQATTGAAWVQHDADETDDDLGTYESLLSSGSDEDPHIVVDPASAVLGIYTAAFEGHPNCAMLSHWAILVEGLLVGRVAEVSDDTVFLNSGPMFHLGTLMTTLATLVYGGCNVVMSRTSAEGICALVERYRCNRAFLMAPTIEQIREVNAGGRWDLTSLWESPDPADWQMCTPSQNPSTMRAGGYGQSEVTGLITSYGLGQQSKSIYGRPLPLGQVRVVDDDGHEVADGEPGEIVCRGPMMMNEYWNRPELNGRRDLAGWHRTGDLGRRAEDGSIEFVAPRMKMIKSASENVYPVEVERCLAEHPAVADVCVIGVPDERWNQSVKALVVVAEGRETSATELIEHCRSRIASYKKPRYVEFVDELKRKGNALDRDWADATHGGGGYPGEVSSGARPVPVNATPGTARGE